MSSCTSGLRDPANNEIPPSSPGSFRRTLSIIHASKVAGSPGQPKSPCPALNILTLWLAASNSSFRTSMSVSAAAKITRKASRE